MLFSRFTTHCSYAEARTNERNYLHKPFGTNDYPLKSITRALRYRNGQPPPTTNVEAPPTLNMALPNAKKVSELIALHIRPFTFVIAHKPAM